MSKCKKIFVFGTGRCGTVSLSNLFFDSGFFSFHEGIDSGKKHPYMGDMREINELIYYKNNYKKNFYEESVSLSGRVLKQMDKLFWKRADFIKKLSDSEVYCDVNPYGYSFINYIYNKYPDAFFLHLIREPHGVCESYLARNQTYPNIPEEKYSGYASAKPRPFLGEPFFKEWKSMKRIDKTYWFWNYVNSDIVSRMGQIPDDQKGIINIGSFEINKYLNILNNFKIIPKTSDELLIKRLNKSSGFKKEVDNKGKFIFKYCKKSLELLGDNLE